MQPHSRKILALLLPLIQHTTNETLYLLIETLRAVLALDKDVLTPESMPEMAVQIYVAWYAHSNGKQSDSLSPDRQIRFSPPLSKSCSRLSLSCRIGLSSIVSLSTRSRC